MAAEKPKESGFGHWVWEIVQTLVLAGLLIVFFRSFIFQNYIVEGESMVPTLLSEERLIVSRLAYVLGEPQRGDIIVFQYPYDPQRDFVKRIIGLPGETVAINNGIVYIDGKPLPDESAYLDHMSMETKPPVTLGEDEYFVMGDNRPGSSDSRSWGPLAGHNIIGKAWLIYFPLENAGLIPHYDLEPLE
ncbi:MAG TPA: signal peptidase I [Caldilineae bacterium]|nr:signal peptidase I [Caldilineae bacterium]